MHKIYDDKIRKAIRFATKVHEMDQKQKRKGKDIAYITHPLTVGLILSQAGAPTEVVVAGILHDVVEDAHADHPVSPEDIETAFGAEVMELVAGVTEKESDAPWAERKAIARAHVREMTHHQILLKSADILSNMTELIDDYAEDGDSVFERFNADKDAKIQSQIHLIDTIIACWRDNPLADDLQSVSQKLMEM